MRPVLLVLTLAVSAAGVPSAAAQPAGDCPYPVLFVHGYTGSQDSWQPFTEHPDVGALWGPLADVFHAVLNAYEDEERIAGPDGVLDTPDDDVLVAFANRSNVLAPGCIYASNWENWWNEDPADPQIEINGGDSPGGIFASESDSNEEAAQKQGYALGRMIGAVLAANPSKDRVVLVGHSMGGLAIREYLQRRDAAGAPQWWVDPAQADGHRVARVLTVATPHRGSNLLGNPLRTGRDGAPDINSAAVRDLRQSYACIFCDGPGPYLFGGAEGGIAAGFHTDDVDLDGDESSAITGINIDGRDQGYAGAEDGTADNPAMPLPPLRYTWLTSDVGTGGDLVVDLARQWLYDAAGPVPSDGVAHRMADTLLTDAFHLDLQEDTDAVARGLDEPDTPAFAYRLAVGATYAATATVRSQQAPHGAPTTDPDWFRVDGLGDLAVTVTPTPGLAGRLDIYRDPAPHETADGSASVTWAAGAAPVTLYLTGGRRHLRVTHSGIGAQHWRTPYTVATRALDRPLRVRAVPRQAPVAVPAEGGRFTFRLVVRNRNGLPADVQFWPVATAPDGSETAPLIRPRALSVPAADGLWLAYTQNVPGDAAPGLYVYRARVGSYPDAYVESTFTFEKLAGGAASAVGDWSVEASAEAGARPAAAAPLAAGAPHPNPFSSALTVPLAMAEAGPVTVEVLDALGRRVATLWDGPLAAGAHRLTWRAAGAAPGAYLVRIAAGARVETRRVVRGR